MSATTKSGRTRSRRGLAESAPPGGFPNVVFITFTDRTSATVINGYLTDAIGNALNLFGLLPFTAALFRSDAAPGLITAAAAWAPVDSNIEFTFPAPLTAGAVLILQPWQEALRGPNGEWMAGNCLVPDWP